ncbi:DgaE family pyridoxal phosphate-dependent ammonia lyase [Xenorhabdus szentirmaii]|uniref:Pyridoxal phosphate-dependent enzyme n=1 Tax=Xenorhabdus szentirmaii DSM 16338 TaxID=1427518 RepID=W1J4R2_9GAMM|nr:MULTISPECIES: DgaE family pyridoxal phosphate-dependent ammonia lyase [Xenorhabdus]MBD2790784.1 DgaE family pyridoxal phosphate-dependent ammonia lyase [Xenorhabdus sp. CUL]MBD2824130.1 DgaE family pyridoxal phosphate-dependent ammonia lyase [Xenorhabdus sp. 5]PHM34623.1 L-seryl-tRNA selenium transferase [Xenorhabdus szentirmaii DSM 16338]PHM43354.1 L-seryl-tRNA selenium transferase [Xenorhabdus szentirmaii]CDL85048.1 putative pyridoxal phosphate-dependent enzyme [Xenorhabdus szentirmaii DS
MISLYEKYQLREVINAAGRMTALGVSTPSDYVIAQITAGLKHYFEMDDLVDKTGDYIARLLNVESSVIVSCAAAGIAQSVAAAIAKDDNDLRLNLHCSDVSSDKSTPREIILPKGHNVNFGAPVETMIALGGGKVIEAGFANECSAAQIADKITPRTAAIFYIKSHHTVQKRMLTVEDAALVAHAHNLPLIVDAAAEEDLTLYYQQGADLVIYSGAKAIEGPTSGLVIGKQPYLEWVKQQRYGIGRAMKIGKEGVLGLTLAIEQYLNGTKETGAEMVTRMMPFIEALNRIIGVSAKVIWDSAGRDIARAGISFDESRIGKNTAEILAQLRQGNTAIYFREYKANEGKIEVDIRSVTSAQLNTIATEIMRVVADKQ